jgi:hypothetical protein
MAEALNVDLGIFARGEFSHKRAFLSTGEMISSVE